MKTDQLAKGTRLGPYVILRLISRGGMGEVYEAYDPVLERQVAVKIISGAQEVSWAQEFLEMFTREARTLAKINHPNVVAVYGADSFRNLPYIAMEYIDGKPLRSVVGREVLTYHQALAVFIPLLDGLAHLHGNGFLHRDLKPSNILVRNDGAIKIVDFGIAVNSEHEQSSGPQFGTPDYLAPEISKSNSGDARSDLWSVGAILYESLVGVPVVNVIKDGEKLSFDREICVRLPAEIRRVILRLCEPSPDHRYKSAEDALADLLPLAKTIARTPALMLSTLQKTLLPRLQQEAVTKKDLPTKTMELKEESPIVILPDSPRFKYLKVITGGVFVLALATGFYSYSVLHSKKTDSVAGQMAVQLTSPPSESQFRLSKDAFYKMDLVWSCLPGTKDYIAQIASEPEFKRITHQRKISGCIWEKVSLGPGTHFWRVRVDAPNPQEWSRSWTFSVKAL